MRRPDWDAPVLDLNPLCAAHLIVALMDDPDYMPRFIALSDLMGEPQ